jgi:hypothetical protein
MSGMKLRLLALVALVVMSACNRQDPEKMSFFLTSRPVGEGGNLGGLAGADAHCKALAEAAGSHGKTWRAYLSTAAEGGQPPLHARDRIGNGPWFNSRGVEVAASLEQLHTKNNIGLRTALIENGDNTRLPHDILTGSNPDGTLADGDMTCRNWKSTTGYAMLGHSDLQGGRGRANSWNSAHQSEGCTTSAFRGTGGNGLFYCFAID